MRAYYAVALLLSVAPASAQTFNQFLVFGPSNVDSGYFKLSGGDSHFINARANGAAMTPSGGVMVTTLLSARFGLSDISKGVSPDGTNYAVSGARITAPNSLTPAFASAALTPSITQQMTNYLASTGGIANRNALYVISAGSNDVAGNTQAYLTQQAAIFANSVAQLQSAGARYILIPDTNRNFLNSEIYRNLSAAGVRFIPADHVAMINAVRADPSRFGITSTALGTVPPPGGTSTSACQPPNNGYSGYGLYCVPSTTPPTANVAYLRAANSLETSLFSDNLHFAPAGQRILSDYYYSLIVAPSQISFLSENAIQFRRGVTAGILEQIDLTQRRGSPGFNVWFNGDLSSLKINNSAPGFPSDPSTPIAGTLGASYTFNANALVGGALTLGEQRPTFSTGGGFKEQEIGGAIFGALRNGPVWTSAVTAFGFLDYNVNRIVQLGITADSNAGTTHGQNFSFSSLSGYDLFWNNVRHGPVGGVEIQSVGINPFVESGSFTSLAFSNIGRTSIASALGYRAVVDLGAWQPFAQVLWNHELQDTANRTVTAALTTLTAPSYSLPIVQLGRDWANTAVGTTVDLYSNWKGLIVLNARIGQTGTVNYGGRFGVNYGFH